MEETCKDETANLNSDLAASVAKLATQGLSGEGSEQACALLAALGKSHCTKAVAEVLNRYKDFAKILIETLFFSFLKLLQKV